MLNDFPKLLGNINQRKPKLHIATYQLQNLHNIVQDDKDLSSP